MTVDSSPLPRRPAAEWEEASELLDRAIGTLSPCSVDLHSIMIAIGGAVCFERWWWPSAPNRLHSLHSAAKSFTATAAGLALDDGALELDSRVIDVMPDLLPAARKTDVGQLTIENLLTMRTGHAAGISGATTRKVSRGLITHMLSYPLELERGRDFTYSSATTHILSAMVQRAVGMPVSTLMTDRIFDPLGISQMNWDADPEGISTGANGLSLTTEGFLRFGMLYNNLGVWEGKRLLSESWVRRASSRIVDVASSGTWDGKKLVRPEADDMSPYTKQGYGYQFWVSDGGIYSAQGMFGQICMIIPELDAVVATTAATARGIVPRLVDRLHNALVPALRQYPAAERSCRVAARSPLAPGYSPNSRVNDSQLQRDAVREFAGTFENDDDEGTGLRKLRVSTDDHGIHVAMADENGDHVVTLPWYGWWRGTTSIGGSNIHHSYEFDREAVLGSVEEIESGRLVFTLVFPDTPFRDTFVLERSADRLLVRRSSNVNSGETSLPDVVLRKVIA